MLVLVGSIVEHLHLKNGDIFSSTPLVDSFWSFRVPLSSWYTPENERWTAGTPKNTIFFKRKSSSIHLHLGVQKNPESFSEGRWNFSSAASCKPFHQGFWVKISKMYLLLTHLNRFFAVEQPCCIVVFFQKEKGSTWIISNQLRWKSRIIYTVCSMLGKSKT